MKMLRKLCIHILFRFQINVPPLIKFSIFFQPSDLVRTTRLLILGKSTFFTNPSIHFLSLLVLSTPNFHSKIAYCCIYFSFMLYDKLFLFFPSLYNHLSLFLNYHSPFILTHPFIKFWNFFRPSSLLGPPVYLTLDSNSHTAFKKAIELIAFTCKVFIIQILNSAIC